MTYYAEKLQTPFKGDFDVIVAGAGPAGIGAAVNAARMGMKVLIIEAMGDVGGMSTTGAMSHFTGNVGNKTYHEILKRMAEKNIFAKGTISPKIDPEVLKNVYYEMLKEASVDILLYTFVSGVIMDKNRITGVICENKSGRSAYTAKVVIDASADGDVAAKCGAEFVLGRESDNKMQPVTLMFRVAGVDMERAVFPASFEQLVPTEQGELQALGKKFIPNPAGHVLLYSSPIPGVVTCNMTNVIDIDGTKAEDLTKAEIICREQMPFIIDFLRKYAPGYENCFIVSSASFIGVRETRHFKGIKTITEQEIINAVQHEDAVVYDAYFNFDVHNITGSGLDKTGQQKHFTQKNSYTIPYGCLVPEKIDGLLLSGRNISGTHIAHSNFRAMPICVGIGEAAGIAAALCAKSNINLRELSAKEIQKHLF